MVGGLVSRRRARWWRINAVTEIVAMFGAIIIGCVLVFGMDVESFAIAVGGSAEAPALSLDGSTGRLLLAIVLNTIIWLTTTFLTKPENKETLYKFYKKTQPGGPGWKKLRAMAEGDGVDIEGDYKGKPWEVPYEILCVFLGTIMIYSCLFSIGNFVYGNVGIGLGLGALSAACCYGIFSVFGKTRAG